MRLYFLFLQQILDHQVFHQTHQVFHQTHQVFHQINFFNPNSESCVNTIGVDNDTLDETLDTLDAFDDILDAFDGKSDTFDENLIVNPSNF